MSIYLSRCSSRVYFRAYIFSFVHIDLTEKSDSSPKLFADDTSLFSIVNYAAWSNSELSSNLTKVNESTYKSKISFNPDYMKPAHEVVLAVKEVRLIILCL